MERAVSLGLGAALLLLVSRGIDLKNVSSRSDGVSFWTRGNKDDKKLLIGKEFHIIRDAN